MEMDVLGVWCGVLWRGVLMEPNGRARQDRNAMPCQRVRKYNVAGPVRRVLSMYVYMYTVPHTTHIPHSQPEFLPQKHARRSQAS